MRAGSVWRAIGFSKRFDCQNSFANPRICQLRIFLIIIFFWRFFAGAA